LGYSYVDVELLEGEGPGGMVRKTRRATGARAFGFNYFTIPPGVEGREHNHADSNMEEVYFVVRGGGAMRIDGEELELRPGRFVRVDPESTRVPVAGDDGLGVRHLRRTARRRIQTTRLGLSASPGNTCRLLARDPDGRRHYVKRH
jgi:quercetin dioxygenase-like cupin family protein